MKKLLIFLPLIIIAYLISSCREDIEFIGNDSIVVEGWIEDGDFPIVLLTKSFTPSSDKLSEDDLLKYLIRWAKVTVSDGDQSVVLTGKFDSRYFPPYIYTTSHMRGQAGKSYTLNVDYGEFQASATTTIPEKSGNCCFRVEKCNNSDTLYQVFADFSLTDSNLHYYQLFTRSGTTSRQFLASYLGTISTAGLPQHTSIPVYRGRYKTEKDYSLFFSVNDTISVKWSQIDNESFSFWDSFSKNQSLSNNIFCTTSTNLNSNIDGGLGYWCGYNSTTDHIIIADYISTHFTSK